MIDKKIRQKKVKVINDISIKSGIISVIISGISFLSMSKSGGYFVISILTAFVIGYLIPVTYLFLREFVFMAKFFKSLPYWIILAVNFLCIIVISTVFYTVISTLVFKNALIHWDNIFYALMISLFVSSIMSVFGLLQDFLGQGTFLNIITGKYHSPKEKEVICAFIDMKSSTQLAEQLEHDKFFSLINEFLSIIEKCSYYHDGIIYKYLGDGIIITWNVNDTNYTHATNFIMDLYTEIEEKQPFFYKEFNVNIEYSLGMNAGPILVGEIGSTKKEIGYIGDTINSAQRIQSMCNLLGKRVLISYNTYTYISSTVDKHVLDKLSFEVIEDVSLKGKAVSSNLVSITSK